MKALVLAGGTGSRLRPLTHTGAKQLIPVANKPIIYYGIEDIVEAGIKEIGVIVGDETIDDVKKGLGDGSHWGINIEYIYQEAPLGLAHCVKISEYFLANERFLMYLGDNILKGGLTEFVEDFKREKANALILLTEVSNPQDFGVVELKENGQVKRLVEKPKDPPSNLALVGVYFFDKNIFQAVNEIKPSWRNELEITDAIQWMVDNGYTVLAYKVKGWWKDTGKPEDILEANRLVLSDLVREISDSAEIDSKSKIIGEVKITEGVKIRDSTVRGPVAIGKDTKIIDSYIGPYTSIYYECEIIDSEIEYSIILEKTKIREISTRLDWCLIGKEVEIYKNSGKPKGLNLILGERSRVGII
jgi:glucose-1-phosphate thymidylyltransferase